jgi:cytidylate kinase
MRIILSGDLGAGKTTVSGLLKTELGYKEHYTGGIFKQMAEDAGKTIEVFYAEMRTNPALERSIDAEQEQVIRNQDNIIVQGRIAPFLAPEIPKFKVFLKIDEQEAARRQQKLPKYQDKNIGEIVALNRGRREEEKEHYRLLYPEIPDFLDESKFDLVIDTTKLTPEFVRDMIIIEMIWRD